MLGRVAAAAVFVWSCSATAAERDGWQQACVAKLDAAVVSLSKHTPALKGVRTTYRHFDTHVVSDEGLPAALRNHHTWCREPESDEFSLIMGQSFATLVIGSGQRPAEEHEWLGGSKSRSFAIRGVSGAVVLDAPDEHRMGVLEKALAACIAMVPAHARSVPDEKEWSHQCATMVPRADLATCLEAQRATRDIDEQCEFQGEAVGAGAQPGTTYVDILKLAALGKAARFLVERLAHSANPTSRYAAISASWMIPIGDFTTELQALVSDETYVATFLGCMGGGETIAKAATRELAARRPPR